MLRMNLSKADRKKVILEICKRTNASLPQGLNPYMIDFHNEIVDEGKAMGFALSKYNRNSRCGSCLKACRASVLFYYHNYMDKYSELEYTGRVYGKYNEPVYVLKSK